MSSVSGHSHQCKTKTKNWDLIRPHFIYKHGLKLKRSRVVKRRVAHVLHTEPHVDIVLFNLIKLLYQKLSILDFHFHIFMMSYFLSCLTLMFVFSSGFYRCKIFYPAVQWLVNIDFISLGTFCFDVL